MVNIYPSLMAADQLNIEKEIDALKPYCAGFHLDVMDNHYVPNITWGVDTVNAIAQVSNVWVHLMIEKPMAFYEQLVLKAGSLVSFHIESGIDFFEVVKIVREKKHRLSVAISPKTPISSIVPFVNIVDQVLLMSVEPGFSGQPFLTGTFDRLDELQAYRQEYKSAWTIGMDGGIDVTNIVQLAAHEVDDCAIGGGVFQHKDTVAALKALCALVE